MARSLDIKLEWKRKLHQRLKLAKKGATNSRFLRRFVSNKQKSNSHIDALETNQGLAFAADKKTEEIENLTRGLCEGCPMSAILFAIYISELGWRLDRTDMGMKLQDEEGTTNFKPVLC